MKEPGSPRKVRLGALLNPKCRTLSRRPQNVIPRYRPAQAAVDGEFARRRRIGDPQAAGEHAVGEGSCLLCRSCREGPAGRRLSGHPGGLRHEPLAAGNAQGVRLPGNRGHPADGAIEAEDRPSRRRRVEPLAVGPSAAVPRREASAGAAARPAADAPGGRRSAVDRLACPADEEAHGGAQRHPQDSAKTQPGARVPDQGVSDAKGPPLAGRDGLARRWTGWR